MMEPLISVILGLAVAVPSASTSSGLLLGLSDTQGYKTLWIVNDGEGPRLAASLQGVVIPHESSFLRLDVLETRTYCWPADRDAEFRRDFVVVEDLETPSEKPPEVVEAERVENACEWVSDREQPCRTIDTAEITAVTTHQVSMSWDSYGDCGGPGGMGNAGVFELTQLPRVIGLEGQAVTAISIWDVVNASDRSRIESEAVAAVDDFADTCCCGYLPEVSPRSWKMVHRGGHWRLYPRLVPYSGPYCYGGWFESDVVPRNILRSEPVPSLVPSSPPVDMYGGVPRPQPDVVCSPDAALCVQVLDKGLIAHVLEPASSTQSRPLLEFSTAPTPPRIVSAAWATGRDVSRWSQHLMEHDSR